MTHPLACALRQYMDEVSRCRLLSSVYQPFVNIGSALLYESEQFLNQIKACTGQTDCDQSFIQAIRLLAQVSKEAKELFHGSAVPSSCWPLCTDRYIILHLSDPLADSTFTDHSENRYEIGDFYYTIIPSIAHTDGNIDFRIALCYLDQGCARRWPFQQRALTREDFVELFRRNCGQSSKENYPIYIEKFSENNRGLTEENQRRKFGHIFGRCLVRNGQNCSVEFIPWKQLCQCDDNTTTGTIENGDISSSCDFIGSSIPSPILLDFIDDDYDGAMCNEDSSWEQRKQLEKVEQEWNEDCATVEAPLSSSSSFVLSSNRIPKRIVEVHSEFFSRGFISFTGGRFGGDDRYALVEIRLSDGSCWHLDERTITEFAHALMYLYSIHKRCTFTDDGGNGGTVRRDCGLVFVVKLDSSDSTTSGGGATESREKFYKPQQSTTSLLRCFKKALDLYMQRIPSKVDLVFVDVYEKEIAKLMREMDDEETGGEGLKRVQISTLNQTELHEQVASASEFSDTFGGTLKYDRKRWVAFRQDLERFWDVCRTVAKICISNKATLKDAYCETRMTSLCALRVDELKNELDQLKGLDAMLEENPCTLQLMTRGEDDLRALQETFDDLKHLRVYREATEKVGAFYHEVRKTMVKVRDSTRASLSILETYMKAKTFIQHGEKLIQDLNEIIQSLDTHSIGVDTARRSRSALQHLEEYCKGPVDTAITTAKNVLEERCTINELSVVSSDQKSLVASMSRRLEDAIASVFNARDAALKRARNTVYCHDFLDQAYDWTLDGRKMLKLLESCTATPSKNAADELHLLRTYLGKHPPIPSDCFIEMARTAAEVADETLRIQCKAVQDRCMHTERDLLNWVKFLERAADCEGEDTASTHESVALSEAPRNTAKHSTPDGSSVEGKTVQRRRPGSAMSASSCFLTSPTRALDVLNVDFGNVAESNSSNDKVDFTGIITVDLTETVVSEISANTLRKKRVERLAGHHSSTTITNNGRKGSLPVPPPPPSADLLMSSDKSKTRRPFRKLMKRSSTCDDIILTPRPTRHQSLESLPSISEESSDSGVLTSKSIPIGDANSNDYNTTLILNDEDSEETSLDTPPPFVAPIPPSSSGPILFYDRLIPSPSPDCSPNVRMQHMVANELLLTEETYVASLQYVIEHYLAELHRTDLPHQLLGQRLTIFGNIEKIFEFHYGQFLPELKRNCSEANDSLGAQVAKCFLKYKTRFHLYALYNKNKPKSDALMAECAAAFFRTKQLLLRDKLDLSSYLLKPVQRMGKYALMLQQLIKACPNFDQEQLEALRAAEELVTFQLRHGNDLLAMDAIQHCDMNLKEQGQLLRQDEFIVYEGRTSHKRIRRVFLFEHLVLFTKPKRGRAGNGGEREVFESKRCIKMNDVGITEQIGDSDVKFELWFLRHTSGQRFVLQAQSPSVRLAWISCIRRILWNQMLSNQELRKAEISSMGGNMRVDLKPSKDRIEDRALNASLLMKVSHPRLSISQMRTPSQYNDFASHQVKRPYSIISVDSTTSSSNNSSTTDSSSGLMHMAPIKDTTEMVTSSENNGLNRSEMSSPTIVVQNDSTSDNTLECESMRHQEEPKMDGSGT